MTNSTPHQLLVIGSTGFTGSRVLAHLATHYKDVQVTCLVRRGTTPPDAPDGMILKIVRGDLSDIESVNKAMLGKDGLIYVASLGFGHTEDVVTACEKSKLKKCVFTSTTAHLTKLNAGSKTVRKAAEKTIMNSKLNWVIIRPTMIYGRKGDRNMERLVRYLKKLPVLFVPGSSDSLQQPNHVDDVAAALVESYFSKKTSKKAYNISGKDPLNFKDVVIAVGKTIGKKVWVINLPLKPILWLLKGYEKTSFNPRIKGEQLLRLNEDKVFIHSEATEDFGYTPRSFEDGIKILIKDLNR